MQHNGHKNASDGWGTIMETTATTLGYFLLVGFAVGGCRVVGSDSAKGR